MNRQEAEQMYSALRTLQEKYAALAREAQVNARPVLNAETPEEHNLVDEEIAYDTIAAAMSNENNQIARAHPRHAEKIIRRFVESAEGHRLEIYQQALSELSKIS